MRVSLGAKFTIAVTIILVATMAANTLYSLNASSKFHEQQLIERGRAVGYFVSLISPDAMLGFDFLRLNEYTREAAIQKDIVYGVIENAQGKTLSAYVDKAERWVAQNVRGGEFADMVKLLKRLKGEEGLIQLAYPIKHNDQLLGNFLVGISRDSLQSEFNRQLVIQLIVLAVMVVFLAIAIHVVFRINVLGPVNKLVNATGDVGSGRYKHVEVKSQDELGMLARAFNGMIDAIKREQAELHRQANFDVLTGLPNRMMAFERIKQEIVRAKRSQQRFAVFFVDLDNFKTVNDSLGHAVGDELLVAIGSRVRSGIRESDTVARLGGDEFVVLAPNITNEVKAEELAGRLLKAVSEPQELAGRLVVAKGSVGIALFPDNGKSVEELMANADNAMYQAKATRDGSAIFFTEEMNTRLRERMQMEQDLNRAIELGQLTLNFQPLFEAATQTPRGAEVLLRWQHPEKGNISPAVFIPLAEATGQIVAIGDWVLEQACRNIRAWDDAGLAPGFLAVNVSRVQFRKRLSKTLAELMSQYRIGPHALELEITEGVLLDDHAQVAEELNSLRAAGLTLSLDDFGTGYSSLSYLKRFQFDVLKIDRSFVNGLPADRDDVLLVKAILAMAKGFGLKVVAEGVENHEQLSFLASQGCDFAQGFLLARPMNEGDYFAFLKNRRRSVESPLGVASGG